MHKDRLGKHFFFLFNGRGRFSAIILTCLTIHVYVFIYTVYKHIYIIYIYYIYNMCMYYLRYKMEGHQVSVSKKNFFPRILSLVSFALLQMRRYHTEVNKIPPLTLGKGKDECIPPAHLENKFWIYFFKLFICNLWLLLLYQTWLMTLKWEVECFLEKKSVTEHWGGWPVCPAFILSN